MATYAKSSLGLALGLTLTLLACGGDDGESKPPKDGGGGFTDDDGGDEPLDAGTDADIDEDPLQATKAEAQSKGWVEGCYKRPTTNAELLHSCATGWRKFDKTLYPASWKEGEALPALP
jgi:hypothetical protein